MDPFDLYFSLPLWLSGVLVLGSCAIFCAGGHWLIRKFLMKNVPQLEIELAVAMMGVVAAFIGIMLAFAAFQVWKDYDDADNAVAQEAGAISELYSDLTMYGDDTVRSRLDIRVYINNVVHDEWPLMAHGDAAPSAIDAMIGLFGDIGRIEPKTPRETVLYGEIAKKVNELAGYRRMRIIAAADVLPGLFWVVVLAGSGVILAYTLVFPATWGNTLIIAGLGISLGLLYMFILDVDHPFAGETSVGDDAIRSLPGQFDKIAASDAPVASIGETPVLAGIPKPPVVAALPKPMPH